MNSRTKSGEGLAFRAFFLFVNFLLIILAYYQVKSASRSILIEYGGADLFPYVWIASALVLSCFIGAYHNLVERFERLHVVLGSIVAFIVLLACFRLLLETKWTAPAFAFYIFVDIFSVILVEQFWSLANSVNNTAEGKRSYWFIGSGGLIGGVLGGMTAAAIVVHTRLGTHDLLLTCAATLFAVLAINIAIARMGFYREAQPPTGGAVFGEGWRSLVTSRYLLLIAAALLCAQFAQPVVEYQFIAAVATAYDTLDARTAFIAQFFSVLGLVSIGVNLAITPLVHRYLGVMAGMLIQPLVLAAFSFGYHLQPTLMVASAMKVADRGLSYSINRASKELLYIPVDPVHTYQAKAWIDMLGYRLFKVLGSLTILALTRWTTPGIESTDLGFATMAVCALWVGVVIVLGREYARTVRDFPAVPARA